MNNVSNTKQLLTGLVLLCTIVLCSINADAQSKALDSLKKLVQSATGKQKVDVLNGISKQLWERMPDSGIYYAEQAEALAKQLSYELGEAEANRANGVAHIYRRQLPGAKENLDKALEIFENKNDRKGIANTRNNLGYMWTQSGKNDSAIASYEKALKIYEDLKDKDGEGTVLNYIGIVYQYEGDYRKASQYALKGLEARSQTKNYRGIVFSMINAGNMYLEGGLLQPATELYEQSIAFAKEHHIPTEDLAYEQLARVYLQQGDTKAAEEAVAKTRFSNDLVMAKIFAATGREDSAIARFKKELIYSPEPRKRQNNAEALTNLSDLLIKKGKRDEALEYAKKAYLLSDSLQNKKFKSQSALLLSAIYSETGDYKKSLDFLRIANALKDSISGSDFQNVLAYYDSKAAIEKEQARVKVLSAEKELQEQRTEEERKSKYLILLMSLIALFAAVVVIINIQRQKKRIQGQNLVIEEQRKNVETALADLKTTQTQLIQREKMASLGELTAGIAHEIQNPLNFVNNFSEVNMELFGEMKEAIKGGDLKEAVSISNDIESNLSKIHMHGKRADSIVKGMQQHSGVAKSAIEAADLNSICDEYLRLSYHGFRSKHDNIVIDLQTNFDAGVGLIKIEPREIARVMSNLYNNAFYAVWEKAEKGSNGYQPGVSVSTRKLGQKVIITVKDNGNGVEEKVREKVFQPFFTTKPTGQGTGLGLSLAYDIVTKMHDGEIQLESGKDGASFIITLPYS